MALVTSASSVGAKRDKGDTVLTICFLKMRHSQAYGARWNTLVIKICRRRHSAGFKCKLYCVDFKKVNIYDCKYIVVYNL